MQSYDNTESVQVAKGKIKLSRSIIITVIYAILCRTGSFNTMDKWILQVDAVWESLMPGNFKDRERVCVCVCVCMCVSVSQDVLAWRQEKDATDTNTSGMDGRPRTSNPLTNCSLHFSTVN